MHGTQSDPVVLFIGNIRNDQEGKVAVKETKMLGGDFYDILWRVVIILKKDQEGTNEPRAPTPKSSCVRARGGVRRVCVGVEDRSGGRKPTK